MKFINIGPPGGSPSGSLGAMTYSHNRYGYYVRSRSVPTNPNTARQQAVRSQLQALSEYWGGSLSAAERAAWNLYADNVPVVDALGQAINLSGINWFVGNNASILQAGLPQVDAAPVIFSRAETDPTMAAAISEATQQISVAFDTGLDWVGEDDAGMLIYMSIPQSPGRTFLPPQYRYAGVIAGDSVAPPASPQVIAVPFACVETQGCLVKAVIVRADGRTSAPFLDTVAVAA